MKILVVGAMASEISFLKSKIVDMKEEEHNKFKFFLGTIGKNDIILVQSGIGRCMCGALIATAKAFYEFDCVINVGIAGGTQKVYLGDIVVGKHYVYGDVDFKAAGYGYEYGQMSGCPKYFESKVDLKDTLSGLEYKEGDICTRDSFTTELDIVDKLQNTHFKDLNLLAFDMESAAFAQICNYFDIPFLAIRAISDVIGFKYETREYLESEAMTADLVNKFMYQILTKL